MRRDFLKSLLCIPAFAAVAKADQFDSGVKISGVDENHQPVEYWQATKWDGTERSLLKAIRHAQNYRIDRVIEITVSTKWRVSTYPTGHEYLRFKKEAKTAKDKKFPHNYVYTTSPGLYVSPLLSVPVSFSEFIREETLIIKTVPERRNRRN